MYSVNPEHIYRIQMAYGTPNVFRVLSVRTVMVHKPRSVKSVKREHMLNMKVAQFVVSVSSGDVQVE